MAPLKVGYWKIRGLGQPIRLLLGYTKTEFEDIMYETGDGPDYDISSWLSVKENLGLDFPNLPYLIDGDMKITQSNAILRYIGRKYKMGHQTQLAITCSKLTIENLEQDGETEEEKVWVDIMENQVMDFRNGFVGLCYRSTPENLEEKSKAYDKNVAGILTRFEKFLGDRKFFAGDKLTYVDFAMYEMLNHHLVYKSNILEPYTKLKEFLKRFEEIPEIVAFMKSDKFFKGPINNKMALIGST